MATSKKGLSRRKLLAGGALAAPTLALLHETVPHQGIHDALGATSEEHRHGGHTATTGHAGFTPGRAVDHAANGFHPTELLRDFDYGRTRRLAGGRVLREWELYAIDKEIEVAPGVKYQAWTYNGRVLREWELYAIDKEIEVAPGVKYQAWTYNGRVPGPTLRCHEGELLRIRFANGSEHPHTIHFHGVHPAFMDGMPGIGPGTVDPAQSFTYEFEARPFGLHLYHCHVSPLASHISRGLYGAFVVDPKGGRAEADELVMVMNGFDTNFDASNEVYAVNTVGFHHVTDPIKVKRDELVRIYLVNALEFDPLNSFHLHANFFDYYPTGTRLEPAEFTDTVIQGQGQRGILEVRFPYPGRYMFHAHVSEFAELGWTGFFEVA